MNQLALFCALLPLPLMAAEDLSKYRDFQLGSDLAAVVKLAGANPAEVKTIHSRPVLIQELEWRPQSIGASTKTEPAKDVVFRFYRGELFRIVVNYDRYETEGLTPEDIAEAVSKTYGAAERPPAPAKPAESPFGDREEVLARWQDAQYRFDLIRSSYGPSFRLVGVLKRLEAEADAAILQASRLDDKEAPLRDAERIAKEQAAEQVKLNKARLANKAKFRP
jgi:hypothetical protein